MIGALIIAAMVFGSLIIAPDARHQTEREARNAIAGFLIGMAVMLAIT